jgi:3-oxoacyl-[acyl-carrier protein] reductase
MGRLDGKVALITGASRGIGAAVARRFAAEGAAVAINHPPDERMAGLAREVVAGIVGDGGRAITIEADISAEADVAAMVDHVAAELGDIGILVANAATSARRQWSDIELAQWEHTFAVNVGGTFLCARAVHPGMVRLGEGAIITVSSVMAHLGMTSSLDYVATKAALIGLTRSLAREVGKEGIRVNSVMPGAIRTEHEIELGGDVEETTRRLSELQCLPRRGYADDLTGTFVYLASDDASFVTGQVIAVDGGWVHR